MFRINARQSAGLWHSVGDHLMANMLQKSAGLYENETVVAALRHVTCFDRAIDVGAHIGAITRQLAGHFGEVVAFEPDSDAFEYLTINTTEIGNVRRFPLALGNDLGRAHLTHRGTEHNSMGWIEPGVPPGHRWVMMLPLDSFELTSGVGLIKIDVEGSEINVIDGARKTLTGCRPVVVIEENWTARRLGHATDAARKLLIELGFEEVARLKVLTTTENVIFKWKEAS